MTARSRLTPADPCMLVIFGASGDLTKRLLAPALRNLDNEGLLPGRFAVVGFSRSEPDEDVTSLRGFRRVPGDFDNPAGWNALADEIARTTEELGSGNCLFYLATQPEQFLNICERLDASGLLDEFNGQWRRVVIEKPFGTDLQSARALNRALTKLMDEEQIYRIDHYLGKETVQNILVFRFGNGIFEPIWNRRYVDHVQITVAETLGVEMRGGYYDQAGALRDMVPNHLFQLLTLTAMEPPSTLAAHALHHEQLKVLQAVEPLLANECVETTVRAQYVAGEHDGRRMPGYREEPKVDPASTTETYAAFRIAVDNWRWAGVPFYLRTGKRLGRKKSEVTIQFKQPPLSLFRQAEIAPPGPNLLVISIQPEETIKLRIAAKVPGPHLSASAVDLRFNYDDYFGVKPHTGYETLLYDAMTGDRSLFKPADIVEAGWAIVDPMLRVWAEGGCTLTQYAAGSDGPAAADALLAREDRQWRAL
ncbi:MAG TPA: glucose-6-phosphate dehydrogenase [Vicinamibacterales bacterium]|nr:glucose-6-phosphate dehydrogenase [Vicinamibacterales bacterium]